MVAYIVILVTAIAAAVLNVFTNWVPRPARLTGRMLTVLLAVTVTVAATFAWLTSPEDEEPAPPVAAPVASTTTSQQARLFKDWAADVNAACAPVRTKLRDVPNFGVFTKMDTTAAHQARGLLGPLFQELTRMKLPSGPNNRHLANDWLQTYRSWYGKFVALFDKLESASSGGWLENALQFPGVQSALSDVVAVTSSVESKGDALGVVCPAGPLSA